MKKNKYKIWSKYTLKRTKLHCFKKFSRGSMPPNPLSIAHSPCAACRFATCKFSNLKKKNSWPPPPKSWGRPWVFCNAFKSSFCINMAPTFLISGDGHGFMNRYTLTIKEIHKLPKLVMIVFKKCANAGHVS